jgi:hypothetical protein
MGRYEKYEKRKFVANKTKAPHPIWQGIGCLMFIIVPIISYALADVTIQAGVKAHWSLLPYQLVGTPLFPDFVWKFWQLAALASPLTKINNLYANLLLTFIYIIILSGLGSLGYAIIYRFIGPPRYGPQDIPQPKIKTKPYKR